MRLKTSGPITANLVVIFSYQIIWKYDVLDIFHLNQTLPKAQVSRFTNLKTAWQKNNTIPPSFVLKLN
jgi:hypothetical protein